MLLILRLFGIVPEKIKKVKLYVDSFYSFYIFIYVAFKI